MKPSISVVIKPTLSCNMNCRHCYHRAEERVSEEIQFNYLDRLFHLLSKEYESVWFVWHGGEPLTLPLTFYRRAIDLQHKYFGKDTFRVGNTIQTNGLNIDRKMANFCRENQINLGISYEGPYADVLRENGDTVSKNMAFLSKKDHVFTVGSTISSETVDKQTELYKYFRDRDVNLSLVPVVPSGCACDDRSMVPDPEKYAEESIKVFDEWVKDKDSTIPLIPHYLYILNALGQPVDSDCAHNSCLTKWLCIYPNGDLYPCAKNCPSEYRLGNIMDIASIDDAFRSDGFVNILRGTIERREKCMECDLYQYCNGGCSVDACCECGIGNNGGDSCIIFKKVFTHVKDTVDTILETKPDLDEYNRYVKDAILGKLVNPMKTGQ